MPSKMVSLLLFTRHVCVQLECTRQERGSDRYHVPFY
jgi:hypothetical protein